MDSSREVKEVAVVQKVAVGDEDRAIGVGVGCLVSKKEKIRDTAVSRGQARLEVSLVSTCAVKLRQPLYRNVGNMAAIMPERRLRLKVTDGIQWCSYEQAETFHGYSDAVSLYFDRLEVCSLLDWALQ